MNTKVESCGTVTPYAAVKEMSAYWESKPHLHSQAQSRLYRALFCDIAQAFPNFVSSDFSCLISRFEKEGESFYLETLPKLGKAFETSVISLEEFKLPEGWKRKKGTRLPQFLYSLFSQWIHDSGHPIWDLSSWGEGKSFALRTENLTHQLTSSLRFIRQVTGMWSKVEPPSDAEGTASYSPAIEKQAYDGFIDRATRKELIIPSRYSSAIKEAHRLLRTVLEGNTPLHDELQAFSLNPWGRHGPGAVAGKECGCEKWSMKTWPGLPSSLYKWDEERPWCKPQTLSNQPTSRLCAVPKDFRGPRLICIEPKENQFVQQGLMDILYRLIEYVPLTRRAISFTNVEVSRELCYNTNFSTIDLKDASDNISLSLGRLLLPPWFFSLITRYRTRYIKIPGYTNPLKGSCLATMGNATCFPLETLIFWALSLGTMISIKDGWSSRRIDKSKLNLDLRVFGDDIIVPLWAADEVCSVLEACGLPVNKSKTCLFTVIRESCGEWVCKGEPIRIFKFRNSGVTDHRSWLQWRDLNRDHGLSVMTALQSEITSILMEFLEKSVIKTRFNKHLQRMECLFPKFVQPRKTSELVDLLGLYAYFVHNNRTPFSSGARKRVKLGWQDMRLIA